MALIPINLPIERVRGDTFPLDFELTVTGGPLNITGMSFLLTVDPSPEPTSGANNLFQLTGTITDGPNGKVRFLLNATQANQTPAEYYYDLQLTDTLGRIRTIAKSTWTFVQDITKV